MDLIHTLTIASIGGIIPCLFWLVFWLREAHETPEPPRIIMACFVGGMVATLIVFPIEYFISLFSPEGSPATITLWAFAEEIVKFGVCWVIALRTRFEVRPIDAVIYMVTVALGFAALENTLFLISPLMSGDTATTLMTGHLRFIGATLLHTLTSATIGVFIAFAFFKRPFQKEEYAFAGLFAAGVLHTLFNFFILQENGAQTFLVFASVWLLVMMLIVVLEKVKTIANIPIQNT
jgi:protease PrsW